MPCALYPNIQITDDTLGTSYKEFSMYLNVFVNFYRVACNRATCNCYVCEKYINLHFSPQLTKHRTYAL